MQRLVHVTIVAAAAIFISGSAATNALFLSSLGRTAGEAALFGSISVAADLAKVVLPVIVARAWARRLWWQGGLAALLLGAVIALSLASGTGYAALTRDAVSAGRESGAQNLAAATAALAELEQRFARLPAAREVAVIEADLAIQQADWRWASSKSCTALEGRTTRQYCSDVLKLRAELTAAQSAVELRAKLEQARRELATMREARPAGRSDPQIDALAELLGIAAKFVRAGLTFGVALVMELGAVVLVIIASGPLVSVPKTAAPPPEPIAPKAELPAQPDRTFWQRQRQKANGAVGNGVSGHGG
jgi:hypothetical protein